MPETVCQSDNGGLITSGGGFSGFYPRPSWQSDAVQGYELALQLSGNIPMPGYNTSKRGYPDISMAGTEFIVHIPDVNNTLGKTVRMAGTSASCPVAAALFTNINAARLAAGKGSVGFVNPVLYAYGSNFINDITEGHNKCVISGECCEEGYYAMNGWDPTSGLGSINYAPFQSTLLALGSINAASYTPTTQPTNMPTVTPTVAPSAPTSAPTTQPSAMPTDLPSVMPTATPTATPTTEPSSTPSVSPSVKPSTATPPTQTEMPSLDPTITENPTHSPSLKPSILPIATSPPVVPTKPRFTASPQAALPSSPKPTIAPTDMPTTTPSSTPSEAPTDMPTTTPSSMSTIEPTTPSTKPFSPQSTPTLEPTVIPSEQEPIPVLSSAPTFTPTSRPTRSRRTANPTVAQTKEALADGFTPAPTTVIVTSLRVTQVRIMRMLVF